MKKFYKDEYYGKTHERCIDYKDGSMARAYHRYTINHPYSYFIESYAGIRQKNIYFFMHLKNHLDIEDNL